MPAPCWGHPGQHTPEDRVGATGPSRPRCPPGPCSQAPSAAASCPVLHPASSTDCPSTMWPTDTPEGWRLRPLPQPHCGNTAWPGTEVSTPAPSHLRGGLLPFLVLLPLRSLSEKAPSGREGRAQALGGSTPGSGKRQAPLCGVPPAKPCPPHPQGAERRADSAPGGRQCHLIGQQWEWAGGAA